jgi:hypothetical protein
MMRIWVQSALAHHHHAPLTFWFLKIQLGRVDDILGEPKMELLDVGIMVKPIWVSRLIRFEVTVPAFEIPYTNSLALLNSKVGRDQNTRMSGTNSEEQAHLNLEATGVFHCRRLIVC